MLASSLDKLGRWVLGRWQGRRCRQAAIGLATLAGVICSGCTVNGWFPGIEPTYLENKTARAVSFDVWGVNLTTHPGDRGLTIGRCRKTYYFARPGPEKGQWKDITEGRNSTLELTDEFDWGDYTMLGMTSRTAGLAVTANRFRSGACVGIQNTAAVWIPLDFNGAVCVDVRQWAVGKFYVLKENKNEPSR